MNRPLREDQQTSRESKQPDVKTTNHGENGVVGKMEELLASLPTFSPAINALSHSAITPQPPAEALKRLTRLGETRKSGKQTKVAKHGFFPHILRFDIPHPLSFGGMPFSFNVALP